MCSNCIMSLTTIYREYIDCLNRQDWLALSRFVDENVFHNGRNLGLVGYRAMLERDFESIADLHFNVEILVCDDPYIASRLHFDCAPTGEFIGLPVNGKRITFTENVFYEFAREKIVRAWSIIDKAAIEAQI